MCSARPAYAFSRRGGVPAAEDGRRHTEWLTANKRILRFSFQLDHRRPKDSFQRANEHAHVQGQSAPFDAREPDQTRKSLL